MNRTRLLTTAAALVLGTGTAFAQAPAPSRDQVPPQPAPAAQQNAPAEKIAPPSQSVQQKASETKAPDARLAQAQQPGAAATAVDSGKADMKTPPAAGKAEMKGAAESNKAADSTNKASDSKMPDASKSTDANKTAPAASTTGQGAGGTARLSTEQRSKITTVIRQQKVQPVKLDISISVGTRVPSHVRYYPLPREVVVIYPEWRGYDYILVGDQIVILDPRTHEIVAILEA